MPLTNATKETASLAVTSLGAWVSVHTADPGSTGASEATGGTPAYARQQTTWTGGAADGIVAGSQVVADLPAGTYTHFGLWSAQVGGTFLGGNPITANGNPLTFTAQAQAQLKLAPSHTIA